MSFLPSSVPRGSVEPTAFCGTLNVSPAAVICALFAGCPCAVSINRGGAHSRPNQKPFYLAGGPLLEITMPRWQLKPVRIRKIAFSVCYLYGRYSRWFGFPPYGDSTSANAVPLVIAASAWLQVSKLVLAPCSLRQPLRYVNSEC